MLLAALILLPQANLFAEKPDPAPIHTALSKVGIGLSGGFQTLSQGFNTMAAAPAANTAGMAWQTMASAGGFVANHVTNPAITAVTGIQPGSLQAQQAGKAFNQCTWGYFNGYIKAMYGKDLNNPGKPAIDGIGARLGSVTPLEAIMGVGIPLSPGIPAGAGAVAAWLGSANTATVVSIALTVAGNVYLQVLNPNLFL